MELRQIKEQLTIRQVLQHYGLKPDKNNRLLCPFHPDKTPSLQIYPATNTWCCFSSNCNAGTGDQVQFIELYEKCSKHEALVKAAEMVEGVGSKPARMTGADGAEGKIIEAKPVLPAARLFIEADTIAKEAVLMKLFKYFAKALPLSKKAVDYLEGRAINYKAHEAGYNSGDWHHKLNEKNFIASCEQYGLLKPKPAGGYSAWAKDCIIFPLKNQEGKIISLYGRSILTPSLSTGGEGEAHASRHFYLSNRSGLYPGYPALTTKKLILVESIIDAASLLQQQTITGQYSVLSLYGTNGLTEEHIQAITSLPQLEEIILMLDADEAGEAATHKHAHALYTLLPHVRIARTHLPSGEDVNSVLQNHDDAMVLQHLIDNRTDFLFSNLSSQRHDENKKPELPETITRPALQQSRLNTQNPELLVYDTACGGTGNCQLRIEVWGGIKITGLDRMKVTLKVQHKQKQLLPIRDTLDLYSRNQTEQLIQTISESFDANIKQTETTISELTNELENYRIKRIEALQPKEKPQHELTPAQRQTAIAELKKPNLLQRTSQLLQQCGIVGESTNSLIAYLVYCTRKQNIPLHIMFLGASGSGKTYLQERISELIPQEDKIEITQITENALYYFKQEELKHKLILIEDLDGALAVFYPLRELQTKRKISKTVTLKDSKGNLKTITLTVEGPVSVSGCTTKEKIYEDNANRCILLYTDQTRDQDKRINEYQTKLSAGEVNKEREQQYKELFKNIQRVLRPIHIINPYAKYIVLPEQVFKPRRTMTLLLGFIEAVTFYHQYQREVKKDNAGQLYIETSIEDIEAAFNLLKDVLFSKSDELAKATRNFFEQLKQYLTDNSLDSFTPQQIRKIFRIEPRTIQRYIRELKQYGFIRQISGFKHRKGFEYGIADAAEYSRLKSEIDTHLQSIIEQLRNLQSGTATATVLRH
ncbi:DNA primase [Terrimonas sp.]|uniref:toprim domain-containing protein n=1 Tax=Terrimonas sp. TaxID=1914338 RepID=UPI000D51381A|nr:toprim domain-containing protein [Terrimonas sp.]PVD49353.1 DNA primase [Terrimonas sp.]